MKKSNQSPLTLTLVEFAHNLNVSHSEFRRLVQLALLPNDGKPSMVPKQISELTKETNGAAAQPFGNLEKKKFVRRAGGTLGAYEVNTNQDEWFPDEMSDVEKALQKDLEALEQMKSELIEKFKTDKGEKLKSTSRKVG